MEKRKLISIICFMVLTYLLKGQIGGKNSFEFLRLPSSARITALGGTVMATSDTDVALAMANPASLSDTVMGSVSINYNFQFAGIAHGHAAVGVKMPFLKLPGHVSASFINYGEFISADETGMKTGSFSGNESAFTIGTVYDFNDKIRVGGNLKVASTSIDVYRATGVLGDLGLMYLTNEGRSVLSVAITNFGKEISTLDGKKYGTPLDIQIGVSNRLKYLPLRFSVIFHRLQQWGITHDDPNFREDNAFSGKVDDEPSAFKQNLDNLFRHLVFNGEFSIGKSGGLKLRGGYNHLRRRELSLSQFRSLAGFSLGFGLKVIRFRIDYGVGYHHLVGGTNHLSISTHLSSFKSKL